MLRNRSVPTETMLPHLTYQNVADALAWLTAAFGFAEHYRYGEPGGPVQGAQMHLGDAWIMLNSARAGSASPSLPASAKPRRAAFSVWLDVTLMAGYAKPCSLARSSISLYTSGVAMGMVTLLLQMPACREEQYRPKPSCPDTPNP